MEGKVVLQGTATPAECVARAQAVIVTANSWHILAPEPYRCHSYDLAAMPLPDGFREYVPIIDVSTVDESLADQMASVLASTTDPLFGVVNREGLTTGLMALGAQVTYPAEMKEGVR